MEGMLRFHDVVCLVGSLNNLSLFVILKISTCVSKNGTYN